MEASFLVAGTSGGKPVMYLDKNGDHWSAATSYCDRTSSASVINPSRETKHNNCHTVGNRCVRVGDGNGGVLRHEVAEASGSR